MAPEETIKNSTSFQNGMETTSMSTEGNGTVDTNFKIAKLSKRKKLVLASCLFAFFVGGCGYSGMAPIFPGEAARKGMSITVASFVFCEYELIIFLTSPVLASYLTTLGPKFVLVSGTIVAGVGTVLFGFLDKSPPGKVFIALSILFRGIGACGISANFIAVLAIVPSEFPEYMATFFAFLITSLGIGFMVGPAIGGVFYDLGGFGLPFYVIGGLLIASGALVYVYMPAIDNVTKENKVSMVSLLRSPMVSIPMWSICIAALGLTFLDPILALHLEPFGFSSAVVGLFFVIVPVLNALTAPLQGYLSDIKGTYKHSVVIGHLVFGLGFLVMGPSVILPFVPYKVWTISVGLVLLGLACEAILVGSMKCLMEGTKELGYEEDLDTCACVAGINNSLYSLGGFLGPMAGGVFVEQLGFSIAFTVVGMLSISMGMLIFIFFITRYAWRLPKYETIK